jgi:hypothetical protein
MQRTDEPRASRFAAMSDARRRALTAVGIVVAAVVGGALHLVGVLPPG